MLHQFAMVFKCKALHGLGVSFILRHSLSSRLLLARLGAGEGGFLFVKELYGVLQETLRALELSAMAGIRI